MKLERHLIIAALFLNSEGTGQGAFLTTEKLLAAIAVHSGYFFHYTNNNHKKVISNSNGTNSSLSQFNTKWHLAVPNAVLRSS